VFVCLPDIPKLPDLLPNTLAELGDDVTEQRVPSAFSDATTASDAVDLSKMTEEERRAYMKERDRRRVERERRRREKYGDMYDEIMKKKQE
jgi:hypothetical protein